jgi:hypothetical protein
MESRLRLELIKNGLEAAVQPDLPLENKSKGLFSGKKGVGQLDRMISLCKQQLLGPIDDLSCLAGKSGGVLGPVLFKPCIMAYQILF